MKKLFLLFVAIGCVGAAYGATAAKGVFSVAANKKVQFANANESDLVQWSVANTWREANKNAEGHNGWYVLNHEEWTHLLSYGRTNAADLNNVGTVADKKGLIILPDGWVQPDGVPTFKPVDQGIAYINNVYTADEWTIMSESGAVFLPCEGYKDGDDIINPTDHGAYWSSDPYSEGQGYSIHFNDGEIHDQNTFASKSLYYSVILVREVTVLDEEHEATAFATDLAAADDNDYALVNRTLVKDGTLYTLCLPFDVPDIEDSPLAGAEVFTFDGGSVSGDTGNESLHLNLSRLTGSRLTQGVPYLLRWSNTGETLPKPLYFANVENWDDNTTAATDPGNASVKFHGVYPKAHIPGYTSGSVAHYNFFLGANNTLYWPDDATYGEDAMMKGFRAYFYIVPSDPDPDPAPKYRNMPVVWKIGSEVTGYGLPGTGYGLPGTGKLLRDGKVILVIDGKEYDLQGKVIKN